MSHQVTEIARLVKGTVVGNPALVLQGVNSLAQAGPEELSFASSPKHFKEAERSRAGCVIAPPGFSAPGITVIIADRPKAAFTKAMWLFHPERYVDTGVHPTAIVDRSATVGSEVSIGALVTVGNGAQIGDRVRIGPGSTIGDHVSIGQETLIYPNVTLYQGVLIGAHVIIHAGTVIGADGFGFVFEEGRHLKIPQLGNVVIEDDVEIGANCTIDRATFGSTIIKRGTKTDNLVHIAHNVTVGEHSLLVAQVGIAGSSKIGNYVTLAGQVGVADNVAIGDFVTVGAKSAVITGKRIEPHHTFWGIPARPIEETKRQVAALSSLPTLLKRIKELESRLEALEEALKHSKVGP